jgi:hypothetical protein
VTAKPKKLTPAAEFKRRAQIADQLVATARAIENVPSQNVRIGMTQRLNEVARRHGLVAPLVRI